MCQRIRTLYVAHTSRGAATKLLRALLAAADAPHSPCVGRDAATNIGQNAHKRVVLAH